MFIKSATRPQALILLKIAPAARTYGLHLFSEELFIFFRLFFKVPIQGDVFHFLKLLLSIIKMFENVALCSSKIRLTNTGK